MQIFYLLSSELRYDRLICGDAGPQFANDYGWDFCFVSDDSFRKADVLVVDPRFQPCELSNLNRLLRASKATVIIRICDPSEFLLNSFWIEFVNSLIDVPRFHFMLSYAATGVTAWLQSKSKKSRFLFAPYVYQAGREFPIVHTGRKSQVLLSGARFANIYPKRSAFNLASKLWPPLRSSTSILAHPGYAEMDGDFQHELVGDKYIEYLSKFKYVFACSSVCRVELMKYREIAYAGAVLVGDLPFTLLGAPRESYVPWRRNFISMTRSLRSEHDTEGAARAFRDFLSDLRDVNKMQKWVNEQIAPL